MQRGSLHSRPSPYAGSYILLRLDDRHAGCQLIQFAERASCTCEIAMSGGLLHHEVQELDRKYAAPDPNRSAYGTQYPALPVASQLLPSRRLVET